MVQGARCERDQEFIEAGSIEFLTEQLLPMVVLAVEMETVLPKIDTDNGWVAHDNGLRECPVKA